MQHVDGLSRVIGIFVVEDNTFVVNLSVSQGPNSEIAQIKELLEKSEHQFFEMWNGLVYRKYGEKLFFVAAGMINHVIRKCSEDMGHLAVDKTCGAIKVDYWFPKMKERVCEYVRGCVKCIALNPETRP